jgi:hypothetical protein
MFAWAIVSSKAGILPGVAPAEASFVRSSEYVQICNMTVKPEKAAPGANTSGIIDGEWRFDRGVFLKKNEPGNSHIALYLPNSAVIVIIIRGWIYGSAGDNYFLIQWFIDIPYCGRQIGQVAKVCAYRADNCGRLSMIDELKSDNGLRYSCSSIHFVVKNDVADDRF